MFLSENMSISLLQERTRKRMHLTCGSCTWPGECVAILLALAFHAFLHGLLCSSSVCLYCQAAISFQCKRSEGPVTHATFQAPRHGGGGGTDTSAPEILAGMDYNYRLDARRHRPINNGAPLVELAAGTP